jgi:ferrous iron transport protein B
MYALGFLIALAAAFVLRRTAVQGGGAPLLLEMPPWRWPRAHNIGRTLLDRARVFVTQTGTVIVALSVVLWALLTFPRQGLTDVERHDLTAKVEATTSTEGPARQAALTGIDDRDAQVRLERSLGGRMGHLIEPLIAPLGFDWRIGIGLIGSFAAREVLVPTMGQVYGHGKANADDAYTGALARSMVKGGGLSPLKGLSLMVFFAIAMQCLSTVATIRRETNSWRWPLFTIAYLNGLAWLASFAVYQGGLALGYA